MTKTLSMETPKIIFTDSGLGGISIMAEFIRLTQNLSLDVVFFNAQYSKELGYRNMTAKQQIEIFDKALAVMLDKFQADYIAIACNTLSVVFQHSKYRNSKKAKIYDIVETGQKLIRESVYDHIVAVSMPTTVKSGVYNIKEKNVLEIASGTELPDAIENMDEIRIKDILRKIFSETKKILTEKNWLNKNLALFLGCTHFPLIKNDFFEIACEFGIDFNEFLNPNAEFSNLIFDEIRTKVNPSTTSEIQVQVVSRKELKDSEINNVVDIIKKYSPETAEALKHYRVVPDLF